MHNHSISRTHIPDTTTPSLGEEERKRVVANYRVCFSGLQNLTSIKDRFLLCAQGAQKSYMSALTEAYLAHCQSVRPIGNDELQLAYISMMMKYGDRRSSTLKQDPDRKHYDARQILSEVCNKLGVNFNVSATGVFTAESPKVIAPTLFGGQSFPR